MRSSEHAAASAAEVTYAIRNGIVLGGPAIGQAAAIGLALTAARVARHAAVRPAGDLRGAPTRCANARRPTPASAGRSTG